MHAPNNKRRRTESQESSSADNAIKGKRKQTNLDNACNQDTGKLEMLFDVTLDVFCEVSIIHEGTSPARFGF